VQVGGKEGIENLLRSLENGDLKIPKIYTL